MKSGIKNRWDREKKNWWDVLLQLQSSVIPAVIPRVLFCGFLGLVIAILDKFGLNVHAESLNLIVPSIVLGLLLVFRTNTAYERFWEGRKLWGTITNTVRNLSRTMWVTILEKDPEDHQEKHKTLLLLIAFALATKLHLRSEPVNEELKVLMDHDQYEKLKTIHNPPLQISFWIGDYIQKQYQTGCINAYQLTAMFKLLDILVDCLGGSERILKTPIPLAYSIHLKQLLMLYCFTLPFQIVDDLGLWTGAIMCLISFAVFGIEEIGIEIENPFGHDANDLPLDQICRTMLINIEDLIRSQPYVQRFSVNHDEQK